MVKRNLRQKPPTERGLPPRPFPTAQNHVLARNIDPAKWYHFCHSYSSIFMRVLTYQDGLKVFGLNFTDDHEDPLSSDFFTYLQFGHIFRGMITDVQIFDKYLNDEEQI